MCFYESLRMESPAGMTVDQTFYRDVTVGGINFRAGERFAIGIDLLSKDPFHWQEPDSFIPERFDSDSKWFPRPDGGPRHPLAF